MESTKYYDNYECIPTGCLLHFFPWRKGKSQHMNLNSRATQVKSCISISVVQYTSQGTSV